jgi:hypothetical protein
MAIGNNANLTPAMLNNYAAQIAIAMRNVMQQAQVLQSDVTTLGTAGLVSLGFASADATSYAAATSYLNTVAEVYFGTLQQGGTGGTGATTFNFNNALAGLTGPY